MRLNYKYQKQSTIKSPRNRQQDFTYQTLIRGISLPIDTEFFTPSRMLSDSGCIFSCSFLSVTDPHLDSVEDPAALRDEDAAAESKHIAKAASAPVGTQPRSIATITQSFALYKRGNTGTKSKNITQSFV